MIVSSDDKAVTCSPTIMGGRRRPIQIALRWPGTLPARVIGTDPESDLAVLRVEGKGLTPIITGSIRQGAIGGRGAGDRRSVRRGPNRHDRASSSGRAQPFGVNRYETFIQTDAAINLGNPGGVDRLVGNLIGINSVIYSRTGGSLGIGFAIPVSMGQGHHGADHRGRVLSSRISSGINPQDVTPDLANVEIESRARRAGHKSIVVAPPTKGLENH